MKAKNISLTEGSLFKNIILFSLPLIASNLLQVMFNMADVAVVGQFAGSIALGAVGSTTILISLFNGFLLGIGGGSNVLMAVPLGAKDDAKAARTMYTLFTACAVIGIILMFIGLIFGTPILRLMGTKDDLIAGASLYFKICSMGMPALAIYNFGNAVYSASGNTKRPLTILSISGVLNIILNLVFVIIFHMGVAGVAYATVISQSLSAVLIMIALSREASACRFIWSDICVNKAILFDFIQIGLPAGLQNAIFALANMFVQSGVNSFDTVMVEGNSAAANADPLVYDIMAAFYVACCSFIGQNRGAGKRDRILKSYLICVLYSFGAAVVLGVFLIIFGKQFLGLFTPDTIVIEKGMKRMVIMCLSYPISAFMDCTVAASRGMGHTGVPTIMVILGSCVFRIAWIYTVFAHYGTIPSLYLLYCFSWTITSILEITYFIHIYKNRM